MPAEIKDLVSVIIPAYNAEKFIKDTIDSVLKQTYPYFEIIVVDDTSQDKTVEIVRSCKDERIRVILHKTNQGPGAARNTAIEAAKGRWIALLDADDQWHPQRLEKLLPIAVEGEEKYFVADDLLICFESSSGLKPWRSCFKLNNYRLPFKGNALIDLNLNDYLKFGISSIIKPIIPIKHIKLNSLKYTPDCFRGEDFEFYLHLFRCGLKLILFKEPLYKYRLTPGSLTTKPDKYYHSIGVYERLFNTQGFTDEQYYLLRKRLEKIKREQKYSPFPNELKTKKYKAAFILGVKNPWFVLEFLKRLPRSMRYRFVARRLRGKVK